MLYVAFIDFLNLTCIYLHLGIYELFHLFISSTCSPIAQHPLSITSSAPRTPRSSKSEILHTLSIDFSNHHDTHFSTVHTTQHDRVTVRATTYRDCTPLVYYHDASLSPTEYRTSSILNKIWYYPQPPTQLEISPTSLFPKARRFQPCFYVIASCTLPKLKPSLHHTTYRKKKQFRGTRSCPKLRACIYTYLWIQSWIKR